MYQQQHTDQQLLDAIALGDRHATQLVFEQHGSIFVRWLYKQGCGEDEATEILQDAMIVLFQKAQNPSFRLSCAIGTYLFAVGRRLWLKKLQLGRKVTHVEPEVLQEEGDIAWKYEEDILEAKEKEIQFERLGAAMNLLGEPCRSLLTAFYMERKSMMDIATEFGYTTPDNAKTQKYKCLNRLKKIFFKGK